MLIAIDGPAGAGKSTVAKALAQRLGYSYLDSGALYRCVALLALSSPDRPPGALARAATIELRHAPPPGARLAPAPDPSRGASRVAHGGAPDALRGEASAEARGGASDAPPEQVPGAPTRVLLDGRDVSAAIRTAKVSAAASQISADPDVRIALVAKQRQLIARGDWVAEGRDIGTVVAPDAPLKIFLTADPHERARRRALESGASPDSVLAEQLLRDQRDSTRAHSPLRPAPDSLTLDTTAMTVEQAVERIAAILLTR